MKILYAILFTTVLLAVGMSIFLIRSVATLSPPDSPIFGGVYFPTGGGTYRLNNSIASTDTTLTLASFKEPVSNILYTMTYLGSDKEYGTLDPQSNPNKSEFISFSTITQNGDGTATLGGVVRGLQRTPGNPVGGSPAGCTASTTLQLAHPAQSLFILSNPPCQLAEYMPLRTNATSSAILVFASTSPPRYDQPGAQAGAVAIATTSELASVAYVNAVATSGAPVATAAVKGLVQVATALQAASSTALLGGSTGASLALFTNLATDTPQSACAVGYTAAGAGCNIFASLKGTLKQAWLDLTQQFIFTNSIGVGTTSSATLTAVESVYQNSSSGAIASTSIYSTAGTYSVTSPAGTNRITVEMWGAGGAGGIQAVSGPFGGGGGSGSYIATTTLVVGASQTFTLTIGQGGQGSTGGTGYGAGGNGGTWGAGGGGSTAISGANITNIIACGGGGGGGNNGGTGTNNGGTGATAASGGAGGNGISTGGGGGGCATAGSANSGTTGGAGATDGNTTSRTNGSGFNNTSSVNGGGGSSGGETGNGNNGASGAGGLGSGGAVSGANGAQGDSGGGGTSGNGGNPGAGGAGLGAVTAANGAAGEIIIRYYTTSNSILSIAGLLGAFAGASQYVFEMIDSFGHLVFGGPAPVVVSCGASPSITGNDMAGTITVGSGSVSSCGMIFASGFAKVPNCVLTFSTAAATATVLSANPNLSSTTFNGSASNMGGGKINYWCPSTQ